MRAWLFGLLLVIAAPALAEDESAATRRSELAALLQSEEGAAFEKPVTPREFVFPADHGRIPATGTNGGTSRGTSRIAPAGASVSS